MNILKENIKNYPDVGAFFAFLTVGILAFLFGDKTLGIICLAIAIGWEYARRVAPRIDYAMIGIWLIVAINQITVAILAGFQLAATSTAYLVTNILFGLVISTSMRIRQYDEDQTEWPYGIQVVVTFIVMIFVAFILAWQGYFGGVFILFANGYAIAAFYRVTSDTYVRQNAPARIAPLTSLWRLIRPV